MRRLKGLWPQVVSFDNLYLAWRRARRGKRSRAAVTAFALNLEKELLELQKALSERSYQPGDYRLFTLYERKPRIIAAAPFRDRVVHHALMNVVEPRLDRSFIYDSYACRRGKGVHAAVDRYQHWARRYPYVLKMDIHQYFPSVDHPLLKLALRRRIADARVLWLFELIIDCGPEDNNRVPQWFAGDDLLTPLERQVGIPIGNLTSQFLANLYLDALDHHIKERLRVSAYLRYVDDLVFLGEDKAALWRLADQLRLRLEALRLRPHPGKTQVFRTREGVDILGYRVFPERRLLRNDNGHRFARKMRRFGRAFSAGELDWADIDPSVQSWIGHARHADSRGLRRAIFNATVFHRGERA